jgi:hypothetical protein
MPTPENFKCKAAGQNTSSVMIMNGTKDPLNPFKGGEVQFFGFFKRGKVRSSQESGQYFADLNHLGSFLLRRAAVSGCPHLKRSFATTLGRSMRVMAIYHALTQTKRSR